MKPKKLLFHPEAVSDAKAAFIWYAQRNHGAAEAFLREVDRGVEKIERNPFARAEFRPGFRRYLFRRFPFSLVYMIHEDTIHVIAVAHARRRPGYWKTRS